MRRRISSGRLRTLVISDLHLGSQSHNDVLRGAAPRALLLEALDDVDRLVLLGDLLELITRRPLRALAAAEPVVRAIGQRMRGGEVLIVPGNHDSPLIRAWTRAQGPSLAVDSAVHSSVTRALARLTSWLEPAQVRVHYPGVWLDERTYATHGHYLDHHLIPESTVGLPRGNLGGRIRSPALPFDYEQGRIRSHHRRDTRIGRALQRGVTAAADAIATMLHATVLARLPHLLMNVRLTPLTAASLDIQMRHAALPAMARVLSGLGIDAEWAIFGHLHRLGPLEPDRAEQWRRPNGMRLLNSGSWLYDPLLVDRASPPHPYWPGGAIAIEPGSEPRAINLLEDLTRRELRPGSG